MCSQRMLELQEERAEAAHFPKRERARKDREEAKDSRNCSAGPRKPRIGTPHAKATHTVTPHQHLTPPCTSLGSPSMHSSNPKVRNSPSANTQSSPKSKQEVMVRSPPVMSPSSAAQMDSKLSNQGKQGGTGGQSQSSPCDSKTLSSGNTAKVNLGLKNGQGLNSGSTAKSKAKRERSTSAESCEQPRDPGTPGSELEQKEMGLRAKRVCVAERRQPYSGTDWCSGDESDEEERSFFNCSSGDVKPQDPSSLLSSNATVSCSSTPSHNAAGVQNSVSDSASSHKAPSNVVYVFTTEMANKAADAVMSGVTDSIITFHMKNISNKKGEKPRSTVNTSMGPSRSESKGLQPVAGPTAQQPEQNHQPSAKVPPGQGAQPAGLSQDGALLGAMDSKGLASSSPGDATSQNGPVPSPAGVQPGFPVSEPPKGPEVKMVQQMAGELMSGMGENPEGLSQEQLEHRERSLQTLRDIQRMLFPDEKDFSLKDIAAVGQNNAALPPPIASPLEPVAKESEPGPLQAMMAQSQSLGKPAPGVRPDGPPFSQPSHRDMPFSPEELGPPQAEQGEHLTPEQVAWLKLQQEFYEEKKRKQEQLQHGPRGSMRAPPPPYQVNPGEVWGPSGPDSFSDQMNVGTRPMLPPNRMPGLMNPDMDSPGPVAQPGMGWPDDIPKMGDGRGFPPGQGMFGGPGGRGERFLNPQVVTEGLYQQGIVEKPQMGLPPGMLMDINRMMGHQKAMEPSPNNGGGVMFPRMPGDGPMSPSRMEFIKGREMGEFSMGPRNMNMNPGPQIISKMNMGPEEIMKMNMGPDEMMKMRQVGAGGGPPPGPLFADQPQPGDFTLGPSRPFMLQGAGHMRGPRGEQPLRPEQRLNPRMSQLAPASGPGSGPGPGPAPTINQRNLGRRPSDLNTHPGPGSSPSIHPLKSPTLGSPSAGLTSPHTPSQLAAMLTGPTAPTASIKSPPMVGSASTSPVHIKSPSLPGPSPSWTSSPKPPMPSPGVPQHSKPPLSMNSPSMMSGMESAGNAPPTAPPLGSSSSQPGPMNIPGNLPSSSPYSIPPEPTLPQNPLSIMMSRMSKFAMPSSTPLYHDAIKTVASSDDDSPPARSPNLPSVNHNMAGLGMNNHLVQPRMPSLSPMAMNTMGSQPHSHGMPSQMPSPNPIGPSVPPHSGPMGPGMIPHGMMMAPGSQEAVMVSQGRMGFPHRPPGFPSGQSPPHQGPFPHNGPGFPHSMGFPGEVGPLSRLGPGAEHAMCKPNGPGGQEAFSSVFSDADLHEVMRPGASGIPEFDLSRIIPSEKPSQTLSYFPRDGGKPPGFPPMQGMMGEGNPRLRHPLPGMGAPPGPGNMGPQDIPMGNLGHGPTQPTNFLNQGMMGPQHRLLGSPGMMQSKERGPIYSHPAPVGSPNMMMSLHGMGGPQQTMMRPRGMATDMGMGFNPGPGNPMF